MKKAKGGAAKEKERKKMKLEQAAHSCSQNISNMFNVMTKQTSKLEFQDNKFIHPPVLLQPDNISESYDEDQQEYDNSVDNPVQLSSTSLQGPSDIVIYH